MTTSRASPALPPIPDDLDSLPDFKLDELVAQRVEHWTFRLIYPPDDWPKDLPQDPCKLWKVPGVDGERNEPPRYSRDADAVIALLHRRPTGGYTVVGREDFVTVSVWTGRDIDDADEHGCRAATFCRAACYALLREAADASTATLTTP